MSMAIARPQAFVLDPLAAHQAAVDKILIAQGRAPGSIGGAHEVAILRHQQAEAELIALAEAQAAKAASSPARSVKIDTIESFLGCVICFCIWAFILAAI